MDTQKFDALVKNLASGASRRSVIGGLFGGALGISGLSRAAGAPADKVDICHYDDETGLFHLINVSGNALDAHINHGDHRFGEFPCDSDQTLGEDGCSCVCTSDPGVCEYHQQLSENGCSCICAVYESPEGACYWMENYTGDFCWLPTAWDEGQCFQMNSCGDGGGQSGGGCYAWLTTTA